MTAGPGTLPRVRLGTLPTPLQEAPRLSAALGAEIWLKRDDLTGLGLGGNKVRALEYLLADAHQQRADCLVTGGGPQSNWAALAALAAARDGLEVELVAYGPPQEATGNLLLAGLAGAEVRFTGDPDRASVDREVAARGQALRDAGRRPYLLPRGGATPLGAVGYAAAAAELADQLAGSGLERVELWLATGSCGTQAGLVAGARQHGAGWKVVGVSVSRPVAECRQRVAGLAAGAAALLGREQSSGDAADVTVLGGHLGPGYGVPSAAGRQAASLVARTEGVLLDPVFAAKAMAALAAAIRSGDCRGPVVFLVTGGAPTLFAVR
ncbi:MAG TPA: pyridoxal-phosphate dependent enzyme [Actinomycetes bacterium]|nr:pyridoxal-phosphate dependent enzyme [Actinomycetes bacterium]